MHQQQQQIFNPAPQNNNNAYPGQMNFQTQAVSQPIQQHQPAPPPPVHAEVAKEKPPLPEEYIYLQTVLEELKSHCLNAAQDAVSVVFYYFFLDF